MSSSFRFEAFPQLARRGRISVHCCHCSVLSLCKRSEPSCTNRWELALVRPPPLLNHTWFIHSRALGPRCLSGFEDCVTLQCSPEKSWATYTTTRIVHCRKLNDEDSQPRNVLQQNPSVEVEYLLFDEARESSDVTSRVESQEQFVLTRDSLWNQMYRVCAAVISWRLW